ncbi:MAG TPA: GAF domain-containing protein, partial [Candidatus Limnocylindrales bacterium]
MTRDVSSELEAARARIAELEALEAERTRAVLVQGALYRIAEAASAGDDMPAFYRTIHEIVGELMYAENLYIALYDDERERMNYPYYVDAYDADVPDPQAWEPFGEGQATGVTAYALRRGEPILIDGIEYERLRAAGEVEVLGVVNDESTWLGVPLRAEGRLMGLLVVQAYSHEHTYSKADLDLLAFVGQHVASALARARAIEETRQRNAELAVINEIGDALARQLEFDAIIQLVGERIRELFAVGSIFIALYDPVTNLISWPYDIDEGQVFHRDAWLLGPGMTSTVITTGRSLRVGTAAEQAAAGAIDIGGSNTLSWLGAPITGARGVIGVVGLESVGENAFSEGDERVIATLAASMGVALENARLFGETKRLLDETDARAAELAIINEIGAALARQLDLDGVIELVGERVRTISKAHSMFIALYDADSAMISFPYEITENERMRSDPIPYGTGLTSIVIDRRTPLRLGSHEESIPLGRVEAGLDSESWLGVPIPVGDRVIGVIAVERLERNAYTEGDERLLATLATSMGVALENARLFAETKRLLEETDERAAELAIINEIQNGLATQLDMQAMYDIVGDRVRDIFDAQVVDIG